jgi:hypothetical protein
MNVFEAEAIEQQLDGIPSELKGANLRPIERLLAERASHCRFIDHWYENTHAKPSGWSSTQAEFQHPPRFPFHSAASTADSLCAT